MLSMNSSLTKTHIFFVLIFQSFIRCGTLLKDKLPGQSLTEAYTNSFTRMKSDPSKRTFPNTKLRLHNLRDPDEPTPELTTNGYTISTRNMPLLPYYEPFSEDYTNYLKADSIKLIEELTGSSNMFCYSFGHRGGPGTESKGFLPIIHSDLSPEGATYWTQELKEHHHYSITDSDEFRKAVVDEKRLVIFNVWRPVQIVKDNPLAICDWKSLKKTDALNLKFTPTDLNNAQQAWKYAAHQKWGYVPNQKPKEVFVFIQHDSHGKDGHGMNVLHASVVLEGQQGTFTRQSYEFRIAVIMTDSNQSGLLQKLLSWLSSRFVSKKTPT
ncbi:hypothetical protein DFH28DRAFT_341813 [Melampsora americana]|nr:hypothetical protein DFH28DRAFT_341813 [Melampsora americana]